MSTIFRGADLPSERAQQVVQRMLGDASAAMTHDVYADRPCALPTVRRRVCEHPHSVSVIGSPNQVVARAVV